MASIKYANAFDDEEVVSERAPNFCENDGDCDASFVSDEEFGDDDFYDEANLVEKEQPSADVLKRMRMEYLQKKYEKPLEDCGKALDGKLNWVSFEPVMPKFNEKLCVEFPIAPNFEPVKRKKIGKVRNEKKFEVEITTHVKPGRLPGIAYQEPEPEPVVSDRVCNFVLNGKPCPYGAKCKFAHPPRRVQPMCRKGRNCDVADCKLYHSQPRQSAAQPRTKKIWFCKNLIRFGTCKFGKTCVFAHSKQEIRENAIDCRFGDKCYMVLKECDVYLNVDDKICTKTHPNERLDDFIKRINQ